MRGGGGGQWVIHRGTGWVKKVQDTKAMTWGNGTRVGFSNMSCPAPAGGDSGAPLHVHGHLPEASLPLIWAGLGMSMLGPC